MTVTYVIPVALLHQAARLLQPPERLFFVTGVKLLEGRITVLTQLIEVANAASRVHVTPDPSSVLRVHSQLLAMGLDIEAQFHSHPGRSIDATFPSLIDLNTARRWETAPFLGAIFSDGGRFVRFFNYRQRSEVIIHGHYIPTQDPDCFELPETGFPEMFAEEDTPPGLVADGPAGEAPLVEPAADSGG
jgi:proteasome lid subunit RPN8/RPN11